MNLRNKIVTREKLNLVQLDEVIMFLDIILREDYKIAIDRIQNGMR